MIEYAVYEHAYSLCEEMLVMLGISVAAVWAHVVWLNH